MPEKLKGVLHVVDNINEQIGKVCAYLILAVTLILVFEVVMRYLFNAPTTWVFEMTQFLYGGHFLLAGAYCVLHKSHVNVDVLYVHFNTRTKAIADIFSSSFLFMICLVLLIVGWRMAWDSIKILEHSRSLWNPPIYPIKTLVPVEAFLLLLQGLAKLTRDLTTAITGREIA